MEFVVNNYPTPVVTVEQRLVEETRPDAQFVRGRRYAHLGDRRFSMAYRPATKSVIEALRDLFRRSFGGVVPMDFEVPPDVRETVEVHMRPLAFVHRNGQTAGIRVELDEVVR